jgi:excisionase family DNA binding protein
MEEVEMTLSTRSLDRYRQTRSDFDDGANRGPNEPEAGGRSPSGSGTARGLLRVEEAAEWLGLGRTKAYELVYKGLLPSVTIGRSRRVPVTALQAFVTRLMEEAALD